MPTSETGAAHRPSAPEEEDPELLAKFRRLVQQGTQGSGQETPFEAVRLAVTPPLATTPMAEGGNAGFLRDGARLLVVVVSTRTTAARPSARRRSTSAPRRAGITAGSSRRACATVQSYYDIFNGLTDSTGTPRMCCGRRSRRWPPPTSGRNP